MTATAMYAGRILESFGEQMTIMNSYKNKFYIGHILLSCVRHYVIADRRIFISYRLLNRT